jgi:ABC-type sugar transport system permease subunit
MPGYGVFGSNFSHLMQATLLSQIWCGWLPIWTCQVWQHPNAVYGVGIFVTSLCYATCKDCTSFVHKKAGVSMNFPQHYNGSSPFTQLARTRPVSPTPVGSLFYPSLWPSIWWPMLVVLVCVASILSLKLPVLITVNSPWQARWQGWTSTRHPNGSRRLSCRLRV